MATHPHHSNEYYQKVNNPNSQFIETRNMFKEYLSGYLRKDGGGALPNGSRG